jgi:hypothetical protein
VRLHQGVFDAGLRLSHLVGAARLHIQRVQMALSHQAAHSGRQRDVDAVVEAAEARVALVGDAPDDLVALPADADGLAHARAALKQLLPHGVPNHCHTRHALHILLVDEPAFLQHEVANRLQFGRDA